jgi:hypothetical protein
LPVGIPLAELTVAVNVTDCPTVEGFSEDATATEVACFCELLVVFNSTVTLLPA